ncbi:hypothetical protein GWO43_10465, partial [candidate division KSB1 bacterium]|nr:hypothetical protein [candidate division KSB1 bacterium]NIV69197.1 hypothetical protein [Phycisphaerae bacterium]NIT71298.1 hypothetical protein [candidate division KSB1 bacterium]NIU25476.1 hypothetical protein [candidate division KSB1 bacterium]NIU89540.1 hypothetical protein [candidate division KSB1 bacterium]
MRWLRNELRRRRQLNEIPIEPLDEEASTLLMQRVLDGDPSPALVRVIFEKTRGLPLFVEELTNALHAQRLLRPGNQGLELIPGKDFPIPESIRDAILIRLDGLSDEARNQLEVAAIAGMEFDLELVAQLSGEETGLDELMDRNLIIETESGIGAFRHALTREAVQSEILWSRRRKLNRDIATYLESVAASPERIAEHWLAANELVKARDALLSSAERSCHLHAYRDAAKAAQRALDIWPEGEEEEQRLSALEQFAHCAQVSGQLSEAVRALREVLESSRIREDHSRHGEAGRTLATIHGLQGAWEQSLAARKEAAEAFEQANLSGEAAGEWLAVAARYTGLYHLETAIEYCDRTIELANNVERWDIKARALALKGNVLSIQGNSEAGIETAHEGLSLALKHNSTDAAAEVYRRLGSTLEYASEFTASREVYFTAYNYCHNHGAELEAQLCLGCMSYVLFRTGDWKQCIEICKEVIN